MEYPVNYDSAAGLREYLELSGLSMKKRFGQNFLVNKGAREKIISFLNPSAGDSVWEIGPGLGAMTWHLLEREAEVTVYEIDHGFIEKLNGFYSNLPNFRLVAGDFLKTFRKLREEGCESPAFVLGNLPYVSGSVMIAEIVKSELSPKGMVFTLQKEVGLRMAAAPAGPDYSSFSLLCQSKYDVFLHGELKPGSFYPRPSVQSVIVELRPHGRFNPGDPDIYYKLIDDLFLSRRKKIRNNLSRGSIAARIGVDSMMDAVRTAGVSTDLRAETLSVEQVEEISRAVCEFLK